jgi:hypothetical protein
LRGPGLPEGDQGFKRKPRISGGLLGLLEGAWSFYQGVRGFYRGPQDFLRGPRAF